MFTGRFPTLSSEEVIGSLQYLQKPMPSQDLPENMIGSFLQEGTEVSSSSSTGQLETDYSGNPSDSTESLMQQFVNESVGHSLRSQSESGSGAIAMGELQQQALRIPCDKLPPFGTYKLKEDTGNAGSFGQNLSSSSSSNNQQPSFYNSTRLNDQLRDAAIARQSASNASGSGGVERNQAELAEQKRVRKQQERLELIKIIKAELKAEVKAEEVEPLTREIASQNSEIASLRGRIESQDTRIESQDQDIRSRDDRIERLVQENRSRDDRIEELVQENRSRDDRIEELVQQNQRKDDRIEELVQQNQRKDDRIERLVQDLQGQVQQSLEKDAEHQKQAQEIQELRTGNEDKDSKLDQLRKDILEKEHLISQLSEKPVIIPQGVNPSTASTSVAQNGADGHRSVSRRRLQTIIGADGQKYVKIAVIGTAVVGITFASYLLLKKTNPEALKNLSSSLKKAGPELWNQLGVARTQVGHYIKIVGDAFINNMPNLFGIVK